PPARLGFERLAGHDAPSVVVARRRTIPTPAMGPALRPSSLHQMDRLLRRDRAVRRAPGRGLHRSDVQSGGLAGLFPPILSVLSDPNWDRGTDRDRGRRRDATDDAADEQPDRS